MTTPSAPQDNDKPGRQFSVGALAAVAAVTAVAAVAIAALLTNIFERKQEARNPFYRVVELTDTTSDPELWGKNFPLQYDAYRRTVDQQRTRYGGSEALPQTPTQADPRSLVAQSRLEEDPRLRQFWAGYAFATDFREERGHAYMLEDQEFTRRQQVTQQPGTCLNCHASMYVAYRRVGNGDPVAGFERLNQMPYQQARENVRHPVACIDCHDPGTMALRVTRPAFMEAMRSMKAAQGVRDYDVNTKATRQEMRTFVCGQCHVEYYFKGTEKRLVYPWAKGLTADSILAFHDSTGHADWTHAISGARVLKAQHPEFELYNQGIHARSGVACADCHMPYERVGAMKISDHWVRSPMLNVNNACQTCHKLEEEDLRQRVRTIQDRTFELRNIAMDAVLKLALDIQAVARADSGNRRLTPARDFQRKAQFLTDFIEAENSMGFHADQEAARVLARAIDYARRGQIVLAGGDPGRLPAAPAATSTRRTNGAGP
jgi:nitrite reductase (cytochrome c-552)